MNNKEQIRCRTLKRETKIKVDQLHALHNKFREKIEGKRADEESWCIEIIIPLLLYKIAELQTAVEELSQNSVYKTAFIEFSNDLEDEG